MLAVDGGVFVALEAGSVVHVRENGGIRTVIDVPSSIVALDGHRDGVIVATASGALFHAPLGVPSLAPRPFLTVGSNSAIALHAATRRVAWGRADAIHLTDFDGSLVGGPSALPPWVLGGTLSLAFSKDGDALFAGANGAQAPRSLVGRISSSEGHPVGALASLVVNDWFADPRGRSAPIELLAPLDRDSVLFGARVVAFEPIPEIDVEVLAELPHAPSHAAAAADEVALAYKILPSERATYVEVRHLTPPFGLLAESSVRSEVRAIAMDRGEVWIVDADGEVLVWR